MKRSGDAAAKRPDGRPVGTPLQKGQSGDPEGMKQGTIHLSTRIRNLPEGRTELPTAVKKAIKAQVGEDKNALEAMLIVGLLQTLQGDEKWAKLLLEHDFGKAEAKVDVTTTGLHHFRTYGSFINDLKVGAPVAIPEVTEAPRSKDNAKALLDLDIRVLVNVPVRLWLLDTR